MKIAVIGGGFTGLTAAYKLAKAGHRVTVFEKDKVLGGLAHGFKKKGWEWYLESAYHHLFANDWAILGLIKELGLEKKLILTRPITANLLTEGAGSPDPIGTTSAPQMVQLDSPIHLLRYPNLSLVDKLRTAVLLVFCKINPFWQPLEAITAKNFFETLGGSASWRTLWEPLMVGKFGDLADTVAASWLWARIKKRTPKLYYIAGGFHTLVAALERTINQTGGKIITGVTVNKIEKKNSSFIIHHSSFNKVLFTVPTPIAAKLVSHSSFIIHHSSLSIPHLHAQTLILETEEPILKKTYWLNITDRSFPFLAVVAHTNMIDKKHYGGHHLTYFGNYLPDGHPYLSMTKNQLLNLFFPYIKRLNPSFHSSFIIHHSSFLGFYAQPVHQLHYSNRAPKLETPVKGVYLANLDSIYPWDRGTNYAVELGQHAARAIIQSDQ